MNPHDMLTAAGAAASKTLDLIQRQLALVPDYIDLTKLAEVVLAAEAEAPGLDSAVAAIKANEVAIFRSELGRYAADFALKILVDATGHAAKP